MDDREELRRLIDVIALPIWLGYMAQKPLHGPLGGRQLGLTSLSSKRMPSTKMGTSMSPSNR